MLNLIRCFSFPLRRVASVTVESDPLQMVHDALGLAAAGDWVGIESLARQLSPELRRYGVTVLGWFEIVATLRSVVAPILVREYAEEPHHLIEMLADLAVSDPKAFGELVKTASGAHNG